MKKILTLITAVIICTVAVCAGTTSTFADSPDFMDITPYYGKTIGLQTGSVYIDFAKENIKDAKSKYFTSLSDGLAALRGGKIDAMCADEPVLRYMASCTNGVEVGTVESNPDYYAILTNKTPEGQEYIDQFNDYLAKIELNGELDKLNYKWFSGSEDERTMDSLDALEDINGELVIATSAAFPPFEYIKGGEFVGYEMELIYGFCKEYGYKPIVENVDFTGIISGIVSGKYDIGASGFSITDERKESVYFSEPIYTAYAGIAYASNNESGLSLASIRKSFNNTFMKDNRWKMFLEGIATTLNITIVSIIIGSLLGFAVNLVCRRGNKWAIKLSALCRYLIKGLPEVVLLMILYYIIFADSAISGELVAIIGFSLCFTCSVHGLLATGEASLDKGQAIAARALGYSEGKAYSRVIFPQVAKIMLPTYLADVSSHIKATAVVGYIAVVDITKVGDLVRGATYEAFFPLIAVAVIYFIMAGILRLLVKTCAKQIDNGNKKAKNLLKGVEIK